MASSPSGTTPGPITQRPDPQDLGAELRSAIARLYSRFRSERVEGEVGDAGLLVLTLLDKHGALTLTGLSDHARVTLGSMSQTVNRLGADGYLTRERDPADGRRVLLVITDAGTQIARVSRRRRESWLTAQLDQLSAEQRSVLAEAALLMHIIADS